MAGQFWGRMEIDPALAAYRERLAHADGWTGGVDAIGVSLTASGHALRYLRDGRGKIYRRA